MANTFPASGNAGIGTTTPSDPLTIDTGTNIGYARIRGRSPAWVAGTGGCASGEAHVGLVTVAGDGISGSAANDTYFVPSHNGGITYVGRAPYNQPVVAVHNSISNVAIGLGNTVPSGRLVAAGLVPSGTGAVQLQGAAATAGTYTLARGYGGSYNNYAMGESGYIQAEWQGSGYYPLQLQPRGGLVYIGDINPGVTKPPDVDWNGNQAIHRLQVIQEISNVANYPPGNKFHVMSSFEMISTIPAGKDTGCGRLVLKQTAPPEGTGGGGSAWIRAVEAQAVRFPTADNNRTWGVEAGVHNAKRGDEPHTSVGVFVHSGVGSWWGGDKGRRCNTGLLIEGDSSDGEGGWDRFILCRRGITGENPITAFVVGRFGEVTCGAINASGQIYTTNTVYANDFQYTSSGQLKENVAELTDAEAVAYLATLKPVKFNWKERPDHQHIGFIAEDTPSPIGVDRKSVTLPVLVATLTRVIQSQQETIRQLNARVEILEHRAAQTP